MTINISSNWIWGNNVWTLVILMWRIVMFKLISQYIKLYYGKTQSFEFTKGKRSCKKKSFYKLNPSINIIKNVQVVCLTESKWFKTSVLPTQVSKYLNFGEYFIFCIFDKSIKVYIIFLKVSNRLSADLCWEICSGNPLHRRGWGGQVGSRKSLLWSSLSCFPKLWKHSENSINY